MASGISLLTYFTLLATVQYMVMNVQGEFCTQITSTLLKYGLKCTLGSQCATNYCTKGLCVCPPNRKYNGCTSSCLPKCNSTVTSPSTGRIAGHQYPNNINPYYCSWTIRGGSNSYVVFSLTDLDLCPTTGCKTDFIEVSDVETSTQLYRSCNMNDTRLQLFASISRTLKIVVQQGYTDYRSFGGMYRIFDYNSTLSESYGYIASPGFPHLYPRASRFTWTIPGKFITLRFLNVSLETCCDKINIHRGSNDKAPVLAAVISVGSVFTTRGTAMHIIFSSDGRFESTGFSAEFYHTELEHGATCNIAISGMCKFLNFTCRHSRKGETLCLCGTGKYFINGRCLDSVSFGYKVGTDVVNFTAPSDIKNLNYSLLWSAPGEFGQRYNDHILGRSFSVTGLTPGQKYTFQMKTYLPADNFYEERFITSFVSAVTLPSRPGNVVEEDSNLQQAPYIIKFKPSIGLVHYYKVAVRSFNSFYVYNVTSPEVNSSDLTPNTNYDYTITAYNTLHNDSLPFVGKFKTAPEKEKDNTFTIVAVVAGVAGLVILVLVTIVVIRRYKRKSKETESFGLNVFEIKPKDDNETKDRMLARPYGALPSAAQLAVRPGSNKPVATRQLMEDVPDNEGNYDETLAVTSEDKKKGSNYLN
ncbi:hypothetical protein Btru_024605, partial [Bulinus truncatus]